MIIAILWLLLGSPAPPPIESHTLPPIDVKGNLILVAQSGSWTTFPGPAVQQTHGNEWQTTKGRRMGTMHSPSFYGSGSYRVRSGQGAEPIVLNSRALTPGAVRTASKADICSRKTGSIRDVTKKTKQTAFSIYGIDCSVRDCGKEYEVDHLISLEIGGSNDIENLWPEPYAAPGAHQKDILENKLHAMICSGQIAPARAQKEIADDWWGAYWRYVKKADWNLGR